MCEKVSFIINVEDFRYLSNLTHTGNLYLEGYAFPLPEGLTQTCALELNGYAFPLPKNLVKAGNLYLEGYAFPLPAELKEYINEQR